MKYRLFDFVLESDLELPEIASVVEGASALRVIRDDDPGRAGTARWFHTVEGWHEEPWVEIGRTGDGFVLKFSEGPTVRYEGDAVRWHVPRGFDHSVFRHILLDQALPLIVAHEGRTVLHAACVWRGRGATLFLGPAGAGKSTLAAALARDGGASAADDAIAVRAIRGGMAVRPAYGGLRLWPDACDAIGYGGGNDVSGRSDKRRFPGSIDDGGDVLLLAVYVLAPADAAGAAPLVEPMTRREAVMALVRNSYVLDVEDRGRSAAHLDALSTIAARVPVRKLVVPRRFEALTTVCDLVVRDLPLGATP